MTFLLSLAGAAGVLPAATGFSDFLALAATVLLAATFGASGFDLAGGALAAVAGVLVLLAGALATSGLAFAGFITLLAAAGALDEVFADAGADAGFVAVFAGVLVAAVALGADP